LPWYHKAAAGGDGFGISNVGLQIQSGLIPDESIDGALEWFLRAATTEPRTSLTNAAGAFSLGEAYHYGRGVAPSMPEALKWYRMAVEAGSPDASMRIAWILESGSPTAARDELETIRSYYQNSAKVPLLASRKLVAFGLKP
jgi:TPR repeat protein